MEGFWWIISGIGFALFLSFLWLNRQSHPLKESHNHHNSICTSPECARCRSLTDIPNLTQRLRVRFEAYFSYIPDTDSSLQTKERIFGLITESVENKASIVSSVYAESGYDLNLTEEGDTIVNYLPLIWMLPGLGRHTFWNSDMHASLWEVNLMFKKQENFEGILREFELINEHEDGWKVNTVPSGRWKVYPLWDQGERVVWNSRQCPFTSHLLSAIPLFMSQHVFGSAMFSVLEPGSSIEPHTGPCNYRLRCHLPLFVPPGYKIRVGRDVSVWDEGEVMVFDDSFVHEVWHEEVRGGNTRDQKATGGRVVLIFDIWHPHLTIDEKSAIKYII